MRRIILFCSLVALVTCSRANEIPLILEQTITMPEATPYWDVMPHFNRYYYWVAAYATPDTATDVIWSRSDESESDTLHVGAWGNPTFLGGFFSEGYEPCIVISTTNGGVDDFGYPWEYSGASVFNLHTGDTIAPGRSWGLSWNGDIFNYSISSGHALSGLVLFGTPPEISDRVAAVHRYSYNYYGYEHNYGSYGSSQIIQKFIPNLLQADEGIQQSWGPCNCVGFSVWTGELVGGAWGNKYDHSEFLGHHSESYQHVKRSFVEVQDTLQTVYSRSITFGPENYPHLGACAVVYDAVRGLPLFIGSVLNQGTTAWGDSSADFVWTIAGNYYSKLFAAYVLIGDYSEQVLALDDTTRRFDIIKIEDGSIWGQTSALDPGYNEMKIIGRYHSDYRRLVVRYGNEFRIYQFGDPIYTAADDSPVLPNEYTLSAYPNPFNPTTSIEFTLPKSQHVRLEVFDIAGRSARILIDETRIAGTHAVTFNGTSLASGIYFARLETAQYVKTTKLVLLK